MAPVALAHQQMHDWPAFGVAWGSEDDVCDGQLSVGNPPPELSSREPDLGSPARGPSSDVATRWRLSVP